MFYKNLTNGPTLNDVCLRDKAADAGCAVLGAVMGTASLMASVAVSAFATDQIAQGVGTGLKSVYNVLKAVAIPVAVIAFALCAYKIFVEGEKGMEKAKKIAIYTVIGLAIVFLAPLVIKNVASWFSGLGTTSEGDVFGGTVPAPAATWVFSNLHIF